ncbi:MAG: hypothetical protein HOE69_03565 [Euryarchaeota archaeon]|nr:hypothetical protein [Euryarchaeota archaeon]
MARFHGYRTCTTCGTANATGHFLDLHKERYCLPCYSRKVNPEHPSLEEMVSARDESLATWKCQKWRRSDSKLPNGPQSY